MAARRRQASLETCTLRITEGEARRLLAPHHERLLRLVREAHDDFVEVVQPTLVLGWRRAPTSYISQRFAERALMEFVNDCAVEVVLEHGRALLVVANEVIIRFKALDEDLRTSNYPTAASEAMRHQEQIALEGVRGDLPRVVLGYQIGIGATLAGVHVVFAVGDDIEWHYQLDPPGAQQVLPFAPTPGPRPGDWSRRTSAEDAGRDDVEESDG